VLDGAFGVGDVGFVSSAEHGQAATIVSLAGGRGVLSRGRGLEFGVDERDLFGQLAASVEQLTELGGGVGAGPIAGFCSAGWAGEGWWVGSIPAERLTEPKTLSGFLFAWGGDEGVTVVTSSGRGERGQRRRL
jgi:hypothetical protein